jgi:3-oxoacyl-(acyl-carrier-protein) synthase
MLGPLGSSIISILRVLTPSEIDRYTDSIYEDGMVTKVAAGAEGFEPFEKPPGGFKPRIVTEEDESDESMFSEGSDEKSQDESKAKIIPISKMVKLEDLPIAIQHLPESKDKSLNSDKKKSMNSLSDLGLKSAKELLEEQRLIQEIKNQSKDSTSVFILNEREKLRESKEKIASLMAIFEYRKSATQEIIVQDLGDDEPMIYGSSGILINTRTS